MFVYMRQVMIEVSSGQQPNPGPMLRRGARGRREVVPEDERRATDMAAMRNPGDSARHLMQCVLLPGARTPF